MRWPRLRKRLNGSVDPETLAAQERQIRIELEKQKAAAEEVRQAFRRGLQGLERAERKRGAD
jgi:hypothetical protein